MDVLWTKKLQQEFSEILKNYKTSANFQTYQKLKEKLKENEKVLNLIEEVRNLQKKLVRAEHENKDTLPLVQEYHEKLYILEENPLYNSYLKAQKQVNEDLQTIKQQLEKILEKVLI